MRKPNDNWKKLRRAALERARRNISEPFEPAYLALLGASALYLVGFLRLTFASQQSEYTWIAGCFVLAVAIAGLLVPFLTGSVLALYLADKRLGRLLSE
jgi:hypothetical protein